MIRRRVRTAVAALVALVALVALAAGAAHAQAPDDSQAPILDHYRIGPEDTLLISVWKNDAITRTVPVRPDGMISLPLLQDVKAAGLTAVELRDVLAKKLAEYIPSPEVSVIVTDVRSFKVSVIGEVVKPGRYEFKSWTTVLDVLALAGGFNEFAKRKRVVILRPEGATMKRIPFDYNNLTGTADGLLDRLLSSGGDGAQENFYLRAGDIILVP